MVYNALLEQEERARRQREYNQMLEERKRWRAAANQASRDNRPLAIGALAPIAVPLGAAIPGLGAALPGLGKEIARDAAAAGGVGAGLRAIGQIRRGGLGALDARAIAEDGIHTAMGAPMATVGGRFAGFPGEVSGAYANARALGASHEEAMFAASGAAMAHPFGHGKLEGLGAATARKIYQAALGEGVSRGGAAANQPRGRP